MILREDKFFDYRTAPVNGKDVVDLHKTGMSFYDDFLSNDLSTLQYLKDKKNLSGEVVMMSPDEYFQACSDYGFPNSHPSVENLKQDRARDVKILDHLKQVLTVYKHKFPMPMLNKADNGQEGLHRMMVIGDLFGWDHKVPVLVVDWADKQRAFEEAKRKRIEKIEYRIRRAVQDTLYYKFNNIDELREQLQWELDKQFDSDNDVSTPVQFELTSDEQNKEFTVTIGAAAYSFDYEDVQFIEPSDEDDLDDLDFEVDDDFLVRYFGDDWRETYPHLKDKFNIKENLSEDLNSIVQDVSSYVNKYDSNGSNQNCLFSTWAVELQIRGVNFLPRPVYSPRDPIFDIKGEDIIINPERIKIKSKEDVRNQVLAAGEGARFYCHVNWEGSNGGHEFLVINDNNTVLIVDGQSGYINEIDKDKEYFEDINFKNSYIVRLDNKEINQDILRYNDEDQIIEWDDELDQKLLEEGPSRINYLPVSDIELFKEYAYDILDGYGNMSDADIKSTIKEIHFEGKLAGYIGFSEYEEDGNKCLGIGNFMIIERGKGLGSAVIQNIVEKYKNQYDLIYCFVDSKNDGAIRLYKKLGKVYDEDGPNNNGEYYVTFWDNGKWELDN